MSTRRIIIIRHGETEWSKLGKHTSFSDIDLTDTGVEQAKTLGPVLEALDLQDYSVWSSPRVRAQRTAAMAGLSAESIDVNLSEWDYGEFEGKTTEEIREKIPNWTIWSGYVPGGETVGSVTHRADEILGRAFEELENGDVILITHGHFSRVLISRWLSQPAYFGSCFTALPASVAVIGFEHSNRVIHSLGLTGYNATAYQQSLSTNAATA